MTEVRFQAADFVPDTKFTYSVIAARYEGKWIYVRHHRRTTWEIPGGHIEDGESPDEAAKRELMEETGALEFGINCVSPYSVLKDGMTGYGKLYVADISQLGPVPDISEIAEVRLLDHLPENLTHPDIQPHLYKKVMEYLDNEEKSW